MKSFKDMVKETVYKPKSPDEQRFMDQHTVDTKDYPVKQKAKDAIVKKKRIADRDSVESEKDYDQAYAKEDLNLDVSEETEELSEAVIDDLKKIVSSKSAKDVKFSDGTTLKVDMFSASAITKVYDALNTANKKKFADAINKNEQSFMKMMDFAFSKVK